MTDRPDTDEELLQAVAYQLFRKPSDPFVLDYLHSMTKSQLDIALDDYRAYQRRQRKPKR